MKVRRKMKLSTRLLGAKTIQLLLITSTQVTLITANTAHVLQDKQLNNNSLQLQMNADNQNLPGTRSEIIHTSTLVPGTSQVVVLPGIDQQENSQRLQGEEYINQQLNLNAHRRQFGPPLDVGTARKVSSESNIVDLFKRIILSSLMLTSRTHPITEEIIFEGVNANLNRHATTTARPAYNQIPRPLLSNDDNVKRNTI